MPVWSTERTRSTCLPLPSRLSVVFFPHRKAGRRSSLHLKETGVLPEPENLNFARLAPVLRGGPDLIFTVGTAGPPTAGNV